VAVAREVAERSRCAAGTCTEFRGGLIVRVDVFEAEAEALEAAGLRE
jgi:hypothetical protein